jgi:hypothetical protein
VLAALAGGAAGRHGAAGGARITSAAALEVVRLADLKRYAVKLDQEK